MNSIDRPDWYSLKRAANFNEWKMRPIAKLLSKLGFLQGISDENSKVRYVSKSSFKKWTDRWHIEAKGSVLPLDTLVSSVRMQGMKRASDSQLLKEKFHAFDFHGQVPPEQQNLIEDFLLSHVPVHSKPGDQMYFCEGSRLPRGFRAEWDDQGQLSRVTLFGVGKTDLDPQSVDIYRTSQGVNFPARTVDSYIHWPQDVKQTMGLSEKQQKEVDSYIREHIDDLKQVGNKPQRLKWDDTGLPVSLLMVPDKNERLMKIILIPDTSKVGVVGEGGQRLVKSAFDLTEGHPLVRKRMFRTERKAIETLEHTKTMPETAAFREKLRGRLIFDQQFETREQGTLNELLWVPLSLSDQVRMAKDLLSQLKILHDSKNAQGIPAFHSDIKMENILFRVSSEGEYELTLSDFGLANFTKAVGGTVSSASPEVLNELRKPRREEEAPFEHRQASDSWSMGLVLLAIATRGQTLPYIHDTFETMGYSSDETLKRLSQVTQNELTRNIAFMKRENSPDSPLWQVIEQLLRVNPLERSTSAEALALLE